jgi:hypothetical protein
MLFSRKEGGFCETCCGQAASQRQMRFLTALRGARTLLSVTPLSRGCWKSALGLVCVRYGSHFWRTSSTDGQHGATERGSRHRRIAVAEQRQFVLDAYPTPARAPDTADWHGGWRPRQQRANQPLWPDESSRPRCRRQLATARLVSSADVQRVPRRPAFRRSPIAATVGMASQRQAAPRMEPRSRIPCML